MAWLLSAGLSRFGLLDSLELQGYDLLVWKGESAPPPEELIVVDFDDATVEKLNAFPIPRALLAEIVEKIGAGTPDLIGLDVLLDKRRDPADDERLARTLARAGNVVLAEVFATDQLPPSQPLPEFRDVALDAAFVNLPMDRDGFIRRTFLWMRARDYEGLAFPVVLASNFLQQPLQPGRPGSYRLGTIEIPSDDAAPNTALIGNWSRVKKVTVLQVLASGFNPKVFAGKIVIVGQSSSAGKDQYQTPAFRFFGVAGQRRTSGAEIHAAALVTLLRGQAPRVLDARTQWALNWLCAWLVVVLVVALRPAYGAAAVAVGVFATYGLAQWLMTQQHVWMKFIASPTPP